MSHIGEQDDESEGSFSKYKTESKQPVNAAMETKNESVVKTITPTDFNIELNNLKNYDYFYEKMSKIKSKMFKSKLDAEVTNSQQLRNEGKPH